MGVDARRADRPQRPFAAVVSNSVEVDRLPAGDLRFRWDADRVYQVLLMLGGRSQRAAVGTLLPIRSGDLLLLGPHLPHVRAGGIERDARPRRSAGRPRSAAVLVQFGDGFLGRGFLDLPEARRVARLLDRSQRGLAFPPAVRRRVGRGVEGLGRLSGLQRTLALAEILRVLAESPAETISGPVQAAAEVAMRDDERIERVVGLIREGLSAPIRRGELAAAAGVSERSLSRMISSRLGTTLPRFVNQLRVGRARELLLETSLPVTRIAEDCGFQNLSNFNVQFQRLCGVSPQALRREIRVGEADTAAGRAQRRPAGAGRPNRPRRVRDRAPR